MKKFIIDDLSEVADAMYDEIVDNGKDDVLFVGFYEEAIEVIKELMMYDEVIPRSLDIHPEEWNLYSKEYYVSLDDNMELWCSPAMYEDRYLMHDVDITFIMGDCSYTILKTIRTDESIEVSFDEDEFNEDAECCGKCCCGCHCNDEDTDLKDNSDSAIINRVVVDESGRIHGFEKTWVNHADEKHYYSRYEHYSNNQELLHRLMEKYNIKIK